MAPIIITRQDLDALIARLEADAKSPLSELGERAKADIRLAAAILRRWLDSGELEDPITLMDF